MTAALTWRTNIVRQNPSELNEHILHVTTCFGLPQVMLPHFITLTHRLDKGDDIGDHADTGNTSGTYCRPTPQSISVMSFLGND